MIILKSIKECWFVHIIACACKEGKKEIRLKFALLFIQLIVGFLFYGSCKSHDFTIYGIFFVCLKRHCIQFGSVYRYDEV